MKKRILSVLVAVVLMACLTTTVFAAESPGLPSMPVPTTASGLPDKTSMVVQFPDPVAEKSSIDTVQNYVAKNMSGGAIVGLVNISLQRDTDIHYQPGTPVTISVNAPGLDASKSVVKVVHLKDDGTIEVLDATAYDGYFTFQTSSFSLFGWVVQPRTGSQNNNNSNSNNSSNSSSTGSGTTSRSPQTGVYA